MSADDTTQSANAKLIATKEKWAREGRLLTGQMSDPLVRLPPGQHQVKNWPVLDLGAQPHITLEKWHLRVDGLIANKLVWRLQELLAQPQATQICDIHCVTSWSRFDMRFEGVTARHLLLLAQPLAEARHLIIHSFDGYTTNLPLDLFDQPDVLLAHRADGQPLSRDHGGPVRLVVPRLYFWKSAKWISRIEFISAERLGFWEERGYHRIGDPWMEERYSDPK